MSQHSGFMSETLDGGQISVFYLHELSEKTFDYWIQKEIQLLTGWNPEIPYRNLLYLECLLNPYNMLQYKTRLLPFHRLLHGRQAVIVKNQALIHHYYHYINLPPDTLERQFFTRFTDALCWLRELE